MKSTNLLYRSIDIGKLIFALMVVVIHTDPFSSFFLLDKVTSILTRVAVPYFFTAGAFLFFLGNKYTSRFGAYAKRLLILYCIWSIFYLFVDFLNGTAIDLPSFFYSFFISGYLHLWYLPASVIATGLCLLGLRYIRKVNIVYILAGAIYIWGTLQSTYSSLIPVTDPIVEMIGSRNGVYYAPIFIIIGHYFANNKIILSTDKKLVLLVGLFGLLSVEGILAVLLVQPSETIMWFSVPPLVFVLFSLVLDTDRPVPANFTYFARKLSTGIYCIHPLFIDLFSHFALTGIPLFLAVSATSAAASALLYLLSKTSCQKILKYFV